MGLSPDSSRPFAVWMPKRCRSTATWCSPFPEFRWAKTFKSTLTNHVSSICMVLMLTICVLPPNVFLDPPPPAAAYRLRNLYRCQPRDPSVEVHPLKDWLPSPSPRLTPIPVRSCMRGCKRGAGAQERWGIPSARITVTVSPKRVRKASSDTTSWYARILKIMLDTPRSLVTIYMRLLKGPWVNAWTAVGPIQQNKEITLFKLLEQNTSEHLYMQYC